MKGPRLSSTRLAGGALAIAGFLLGVGLNLFLAEPSTLAWKSGAGAAVSLIPLTAAVVWTVRGMQKEWRNCRDSEHRIQTALQSIEEAVVSINRAGQILHFNEAAQALTGWSRTEAEGRPLHEVYRVLQRPSREPREDLLRRVLENDDAVRADEDFILLARDGSEHPITERVTPVRDDVGKITGLVLVCRDLTQQDLGESALRASQEMFHIITESVSDLIAVATLDGRSIYYSQSYPRLLGVTVGEWTGASLEDLHPEDRGRIRKAFGEAVSTGRDQRIDYRLKRKNGSEVYLEGVFSVIRNRHGDPDKVLIVSRDLSGRHEAETQILHEKELTDTLINAMPGVFYLYKAGGRLLRWNANLEAVTGYTAAEVAALHPSVLFLAEEASLVEQWVERCLREGSAEIEVHLRSRHGWAIPYHVTAQRIVIGGRRCMLGLGMEITARKAAEEAIRGTMRRLERQNAALAEQANNPDLLGNDIDAALRGITETAARTLNVRRVAIWLFDATQAEVTCVDLFEAEKQQHSCGMRVLASDYPAYFAAIVEGRTIPADYARTDPRTREFASGYLEPLGIHSLLDAPIRAGGKLVGILCHEQCQAPREWTLDEQNFAGSMADLASISMEVEQRRQAELALVEARDFLEVKVVERTRDLETANERLTELDKLKSEFLATMSHELRTPLNSIIGFTGILRQGLAGDLNEEQRKQLGMVHSSARHLLTLINDLLDLSRIESGKMEIYVEKIRLDEVVREVVELLRPVAERKRLALEVEQEDLSFTLRSDRQKVVQILLNLVNNALKFTSKGAVRISVKSRAAAMEVTVTDTGIGIEAQNMRRLFEAFRQVDGSARRIYEGTGLGLYLSRQLVTMLGGRIWAESEFGLGSRFTFTLPSDPPVTPQS